MQQQSFSEWSAAYCGAHYKTSLECAFRVAIEGLNHKAPAEQILAAMSGWATSIRARAILEATRVKIEGNPFAAALALNDGGEALWQSLETGYLPAIRSVLALQRDSLPGVLAYLLAETTDLDAVLAKGCRE